MMKRLFIAVSLVVLILAALVLYQHQNRIPAKPKIPHWRPTVIQVTGQCFLTKANAARAIPAKADMAVATGDTLSTMAQSEMRVSFNHTDYIVLGPTSTVVLHATASPQNQPIVQTQLLAGKVHSDVDLLTSQGGTYGVKTPSVSTSNKQTAYTVEMNLETDVVSVSVLEGEVTVKQEQNAGEITITEGFVIEVDPQKLLPEPRPFSMPELMELVKWVDHNLKQIGQKTKALFQKYQSRKESIPTGQAEQERPVLQVVKAAPSQVSTTLARNNTVKEPNQTPNPSEQSQVLSREQWGPANVKSILLEKKSGVLLSSPGRTLPFIARVLGRNRDAFHYVFKDHHRKTGKYYQGKMLLEFGVAHNGSVDDVSVISSTIGNRTIEQEIAKQVSGLRFAPMPKDTGTVTYRCPMRFEYGKEDFFDRNSLERVAAK